MSARQQGQGEDFLRKFPDEGRVLAFFAPVKWADCLSNPSHSLLYPTVTLKRADELYHAGLAKLVVKNNLRGIFTLADPREPINEAVIDQTAGLLVAKHGAELPLFAMLYYFASYLTEYKSSYGKFDLQDVLRQIGKAFMPWWRGRIGRVEDTRRSEGGGVTGKAALWQYLRNEYVAKGRSVRESALYEYCSLSDADVAAIEGGEEMVF